jgi:hypothetical protein
VAACFTRRGYKFTSRVICAYLRVIHVRYTRGKNTVYMVLYGYLAYGSWLYGGVWCLWSVVSCARGSLNSFLSLLSYSLVFLFEFYSLRVIGVAGGGLLGRRPQQGCRRKWPR